MSYKHNFVKKFSDEFRDIYTKSKVLMTFDEYISLLSKNPKKYIRNSAQYLIDTFEYFGTEHVKTLMDSQQLRFKLFNIGTERSGPIIGGEPFQNEFYYVLKNFEQSGFNSLLTLFHGPNGSAKSSTVETIANAMERYSKTEEGAIYRFNWIFPTDKDSFPSTDSGSKIGFSKLEPSEFHHEESFALLEEGKISGKLISEFKENPIFLIPMPFREELLKSAFKKSSPKSEGDIKISPQILGNGLSKKNQDIFEHLLNSYHGDLSKVYRHVQVERFYYSKQYKVGISTVEPQMSIDAFEKQVTLDKNYSNLPSILQSINFHQYVGPIVESNRGLLEFSDLLKRPIDTFKYLINTIEKSAINLPSGTAGLDVIFVATTNDKHLDAFKTIPDFSSFKGRFELVKVPYLLNPEKEKQIFNRDLEIISKSKPITPHTLDILCNWAVLTRLKKPDSELYEQKYRSLVSRIDPISKLNLYLEKPLTKFTREEQSLLKEIRNPILYESKGTLIYEGRFGASPREIKGLLYKSAQNAKYKDLNPMALFEEIQKLIKDKSVYEFLQFEPKDHYHDVHYFLNHLIEEFSKDFENEVIQSMSMVGEDEYTGLLERYINHVVASIKREKILDDVSQNYVEPSENLMKNIEDILKIGESPLDFRNKVLGRIAAFRIENPSEDVQVHILFEDILNAIKTHSYNEKRKVIDSNFQAMIAIEQGESVSDKEKNLAEETYKAMEEKFGYTRTATFDCMKYIYGRKQNYI